MKKLARLAIAVGLVSLFVWIIASCTLFAGLAADPSDAAVTPDVDATAPPHPGDGCGHFSPPSARPDLARGDGPSFVVVGRSIRFLGDAPGYDLDKACTACDGGIPFPASCALPSPLDDSGPRGICDVDGDGGIDNVASKLAEVFKQFSNLETEANDSIQRGEAALLVRIEGYNGLPHDAEVYISIFRSFGPEQPSKDGGGGVERAVPDFTRIQEWSIDPESLVTGTEAPKETGSGYVVGNTLVADVSPVTVHPALRMTFKASKLTGQIVKDTTTGAYRIENVIVAGRWPVDDAVTSLGQLTVTRNAVEERLCDRKTPEVAGFYEFMRSTLCQSVDVYVDPAHDGEGLPCNAISGGAAIETVAAKIGSRSDAGVVATPCVQPKPCR